MILGICGSRNFKDYKKFCDVMKDFKCVKIYSGACKGADQLAKRWAKENNIDFDEFPPDFIKYPTSKYGNKAYYERNVQIVDASDEILAFKAEDSRGTDLTIDIAKKKGKKYHIIDI